MWSALEHFIEYLWIKFSYYPSEITPPMARLDAAIASPTVSYSALESAAFQLTNALGHPTLLGLESDFISVSNKPTYWRKQYVAIRTQVLKKLHTAEEMMFDSLLATADALLAEALATTTARAPMTVAEFDAALAPAVAALDTLNTFLATHFTKNEDDLYLTMSPTRYQAYLALEAKLGKIDPDTHAMTGILTNASSCTGTDDAINSSRDTLIVRASETFRQIFKRLAPHSLMKSLLLEHVAATYFDEKIAQVNRGESSTVFSKTARHVFDSLSGITPPTDAPEPKKYALEQYLDESPSFSSALAALHGLPRRRQALKEAITTKKASAALPTPTLLPTLPSVDTLVEAATIVGGSVVGRVMSRARSLMGTRARSVKGRDEIHSGSFNPTTPGVSSTEPSEPSLLNFVSSRQEFKLLVEKADLLHSSPLRRQKTEQQQTAFVKVINAVLSDSLLAQALSGEGACSSSQTEAAHGVVKTLDRFRRQYEQYKGTQPAPRSKKASSTVQTLPELIKEINSHYNLAYSPISDAELQRSAPLISDNPPTTAREVVMQSPAFARLLLKIADLHQGDPSLKADTCTDAITRVLLLFSNTDQEPSVDNVTKILNEAHILYKKQKEANASRFQLFQVTNTKTSILSNLEELLDELRDFRKQQHPAPTKHSA